MKLSTNLGFGLSAVLVLLGAVTALPIAADADAKPAEITTLSLKNDEAKHTIFCDAKDGKGFANAVYYTAGFKQSPGGPPSMFVFEPYSQLSKADGDATFEELCQQVGKGTVRVQNHI
ncbi:hypothetical protein BCV70DRAFT_217211 [Testicularia cyperi]|uniref:Uncharacterized protein n=1 Tax=Testicularia cyperi TaxID=1882483 RepID=A0A317XSD2_9BASI|nr:hypothetical protein BCV70DRAFT_217211 [Testicularia cyperi]